MNLTQAEILRYSRHLMLPEVGLAGQRKLKDSSVLIVGTGGLGSPVAMYLAAAGVGHIGVVDGDRVELSNLQRQVIHGESTLGMRKVASALKRMLDINPHIQVSAYEEPFTTANAMRIARPYELIIDCSDNFPTRYLTNDLSVLTGKPNIYGAIYRFDGQVSVFDAKQGPCYRCLFPEPPPPYLAPISAEGGVLGVLPGVVGMLQATEALKILLESGEPLVGRLLLYNALEPCFEFVKLHKHPQCKACSEHPSVTTLIDYEAFCGFNKQEKTLLEENHEITAADLAARLDQSSPLQLIDVREPHELDISALPKAHNIPLGQLAQRLSELSGEQEIVLICRAGIRSARALEILLSAGFTQVSHLRGGINAWAREVDSRIAVY
ncbi:MAG: molybdopterin-synthase adenylyltransferase MoeB [Anaerolineales bacterium]|jgi:adenylyltransferase/sulfurtransferase|nr:molybdopterin-synthase adenylyltransferase MoeB [Anaerolineales bacterium]